MTALLTLQQGSVDAKPEEAGMDPQRLELLDAHFARLIEAGKLQGASYLVSRYGRIVVNKAQGKLTYKADSAELRTDSVRKVYSITKAVVAVAIMQLCEAGKLYLQQPVAGIIPEFDTNLHRSITIWHLLTHTSGLRADPGSNVEPYSLPWYEWWVREKKEKADAWESADWIKIILSGPLSAKPGERWAYCSAGFVLLSEVIARVSGMSFDAYVQTRIADSIGMSRSSFLVPEDLRAEVCFTGPWEEQGIVKPADLSTLPPRGGNGYYSTLEDLHKFGQTMLNGGIAPGTGEVVLGRRTVEAMVRNQLRGVPNNCWGGDVADTQMALGWSLNHQDICTPGTFSHEGYGHSGLYIDPAEQLVVVYLVPNQAGWLPEAVINPRAIIWSALQ
ncbi:serine hydrolase [Paenibacillus sp. R14(2021)]|uniref:serine hydrolase domain-containing protein n=1 Tax=Paenibacillus sp. R14(2021) TaxID=2859228 RepID=UPI001C6118C0|nr:serine hydrolase domain-containing protein [Paenibacillus sp. R14(2021)]